MILVRRVQEEGEGRGTKRGTVGTVCHSDGDLEKGARSALGNTCRSKDDIQTSAFSEPHATFGTQLSSIHLHVLLCDDPCSQIVVMPYNLVSNCVLVREIVWLRAVPTLAAEDDEVRAKVVCQSDGFPKWGIMSIVFINRVIPI